MKISPFLKVSFSLAAFALAFFAFSGSALAAGSVPALTLSAADYSETFSKDAVAGWLRLETTLSYDPSRFAEAEDTSFCPAKDFWCDFSVSRQNREKLRVFISTEIDEDGIRSFVDTFSEKVDQDPKDAVFSADESGNITVAKKEEMGRALDKEKSVALISKTLENSGRDTQTVKLPTEVTQPKIKGSDKERLGLKELLGQGKTNFRGSPKNRVYNINRSLEQFQNIIIAPGQEFSFVEYLGEVDGEHGYLPELVIRNNKTEPEFGGGVCQVSSTVFRAAIYSGLKITERKNHSYPVQYYKPYGMDATIYIPRPDLKFVNNTPGSILMQATIEGTELTFRFFGTKDGRNTSVDGPHILESNPDGSMKTVFTQSVKDESGKEIIKDSFWSNYKSPSLFPHPGEEKKLTEKPKDWSNKQWSEYKRINP